MADAKEALLGSLFPPSRSWKHGLAGYVCVLLVVVTWVAQSEVAQAVETTSSYNRPYLITFFNHSLCVLLAPVLGLGLLLAGSEQSPFGQLFARRGRVLREVVVITVLYQAADWVWYIGLASTSVGDGTIIFNSMSVYVFLLEWLAGKTHISVWSGLAVALALLGVVVVETSPGANNVAGAAAAGCYSQGVGNGFVMLAGVLYAVYQLLIERVVPDADAATTTAFVSIQGLATVLLLWPGIVLLNYLPASCLSERFEWPQSDAAWGMALSGALALAFNIVFCLAVVLTSPLTTSVGCMLSVPVSLLADRVLHGDPIGASALGGSALVITGFVMITYLSAQDRR